ncbi:MAG: PIN domain-containing protein [Chitinophagales bacterium]|nr:PIN domain-containing protein [Chitinophagales bacterium]
MKIFLDANILVAVLNKQYPLFSYAAKIVSLSNQSKYHLYTSPICLAIAFYFAEKKSGTQKAKEKIDLLSKHIHVALVAEQAVQACLKNSAIHDFEDGLEYYSAVENKCEVIITEDVSDFYFSELPVYDSKSFLYHISKS